MDFSKLLNLAKLFHGFVKVVTWISQSLSMYFLPLPNKTKLKVDQDFKA